MSDEWKTAHDSFAIDAKYSIDETTGFLHLPLTMAKVGILDYPGDGCRRFCPPEVLKAAVDSLDFVPVTRKHPGVLITIDNHTQISKGIIKPGSCFENGFVKGNAIIQDRGLIEDVLAKRISETSCGYKFKEDNKAGKNEHGKYDSSYTFIKYNHVAAVPSGRAGKDVKFQIDKKGEPMSDIKTEKELPALKIGNNQFLDKVTIRYGDDTKVAVDALTGRESKLIEIALSQADTIQTLESAATANKESLDKIKTANDGAIPKTEVGALVAELLDARQVAEKIGLDCQTETDAQIIKQKSLEKLLPKAYEDLKSQDRLKSKVAVDAAYGALKENMGFHQEMFNTEEALKGNQGHKVTQSSESSFHQDLRTMPR